MVRYDGHPDPTTIFRKIFLYAVLLVLGLTIFFGSFYQIDAGQRGVLLTFGRASEDIKEPGLHFKLPLVQRIVKMDIRTQKYETDASAASHDLQDVHTKIAVNYRLVPSEVVNIYSEVGQAYQDRLIQPAVQEVVKASTAEFTAEQLITDRESVKRDIETRLGDRLRSRNIIVEAVSITDFDFSESFSAAIEAKVTADQLRLKSINDLERIKIEAQQRIAEAEGRKQATILNAEAEAEAVRIVQQELSRSDEYIDWYAVNKWDGKLPLATGGVTPFIDLQRTTTS